MKRDVLGLVVLGFSFGFAIGFNLACYKTQSDIRKEACQNKVAEWITTENGYEFRWIKPEEKR